MDDINDKSKEPVQQLISELGDLLKFIQENKECVDIVLEKEMEAQAGVIETNVDMQDEGKEQMHGEEGGPIVSELRKAVTMIVDKQLAKEDEYTQKLNAAIIKLESK